MAKLNLNKAPNNQMIKEVQDKANKQANAITVIDLDVSLIRENPDNRKIFNMEDIERLAETIKEEGFSGSIEVYQNEDGTYEISSGHRRFAAVMMLKWKTIPATVSPAPEKNTKKRRRLIKGNINNRIMTPMDWAKSLQYHNETLIMEEMEKGGNHKAEKFRGTVDRYEILAKEFGMDRRKVLRYIALNSLIPELQKLVEINIIPWTTMSPIGKAEPEEIQIRLYNDIQAMRQTLDEDESLTGTQVNKILDNIKNEINREVAAETQSDTSDMQSVTEPTAISGLAEQHKEFINQYTDAENEPKVRKPYMDSVENELFEENNQFSGDSAFAKPTDISYLEKDNLENAFATEDSINKDENEAVSEPTYKNVPKAPIDSVIFNVSLQLEKMITNEFSVSDKNDVKNSLNRLKEVIAKIENEL